MQRSSISKDSSRDEERGGEMRHFDDCSNMDSEDPANEMDWNRIGMGESKAEYTRGHIN